jgi:hypothetical protein
LAMRDRWQRYTRILHRRSLIRPTQCSETTCAVGARNIAGLAIPHAGG